MRGAAQPKGPVQLQLLQDLNMLPSPSSLHHISVQPQKFISFINCLSHWKAPPLRRIGSEPLDWLV